MGDAPTNGVRDSSHVRADHARDPGRCQRSPRRHPADGRRSSRSPADDRSSTHPPRPARNDCVHGHDRRPAARTASDIRHCCPARPSGSVRTRRRCPPWRWAPPPARPAGDGLVVLVADRVAGTGADQAEQDGIAGMMLVGPDPTAQQGPGKTADRGTGGGVAGGRRTAHGQAAAKHRGDDRGARIHDGSPHREADVASCNGKLRTNRESNVHQNEEKLCNSGPQRLLEGPLPYATR